MNSKLTHTKVAKGWRRGCPKLSEQQAISVCQMIGSYWTDKQIQEFLKNEWNILVRVEAINEYRRRDLWRNHIQRFREEFESKIMDVSLSSKRRRIEEYEDLYFKLKGKNQYAQAAGVLKNIQGELEPVRNSGDTYIQYNQYNNLSDDEIDQKIIENANRLLELKRNENAGEIEETARKNLQGEPTSAQNES